MYSSGGTKYSYSEILVMQSILVTAREPEATVQTGIELGSECIEPRVPILANGNLFFLLLYYGTKHEYFIIKI